MNNLDIECLEPGELVRILRSIDGEKDLVVEPSLTRHLEKIASMSLLQQHNCSRVQQLHPEVNLVWGENVVHRIYLVQTSVEIAKLISGHIRAEPLKKYSVAYVGDGMTFYKTLEREFEENSVFSSIDLYELQFKDADVEVKVRLDC
ncbi:hypothetical protein L596_025473 [Steinernema carpocapsae]|uniref:Uncharacterized protein n=1 Tax=Steinernema carpocapsae TaxID=34508 RepID=A0A4U5M7V6_STECR|nr:hypothetical protein L596_025473 [Steinernema carpocapsae]